MTKIHLTALFAVGVFAFAACTKDDDTPTATGALPTTDSNNNEETGDGDGDGDGDPAGDGDGTPSGDGDGEPATFVDEGDLPSANVCDPWAEDCPEGEKCAAWASMGGTWDANKCVETKGNGQTGDDCTYDGAAQGTDDCDVGHMCYFSNAEGLGSCIPLCTGSNENPMCPDGFNCSISNMGSLLLCLPSCDPLLQDCEAADTGCFWDGSLFNCDPSGDLLEGEPCGFINDCSPGHVCLGAEALPVCNGSACCVGFCDLTDPTCQIDGTECIAFFEEGTALPGLESTGICAIPG